MSYTRQFDDISCGPVAIFNAHIWKKMYPDTVNFYKSKCLTNNFYGTYFQMITNVLTKSKFNTVRLTYDTNRMKSGLDRGMGLILLYCHNSCNDDFNQLGAHYVFVHKEGNHYEVNNYISSGHRYLKRKIFSSWDELYNELLINKQMDSITRYPHGCLIN